MGSNTPFLGKVFGVGLARTGNRSLAAALTILGYKVVWFPHDALTVGQLMQGDYRLKILDSHDGIVDGVAPWFHHLDARYNARFILTIRSQTDWLNSCARHWAGRGEAIDDFTRFYRQSLYGSPAFGAELFKSVYQNHYQRVSHYFEDRRRAGAASQLLTLNICAGDGWEKLAPFLGCPAPPIPFPWINDLNDLEVCRIGR